MGPEAGGGGNRGVEQQRKKSEVIETDQATIMTHKNWILHEQTDWKKPRMILQRLLILKIKMK